MANQTMLSAQKILKEYYVEGVPLDLAYRDRPLMALIPKDESVEGKVLPVPVTYENPQGTSSTFSAAQSNETPNQFGSFYLTMQPKYSLAQIDAQLLKATKTSRGSFVREAQYEIDKSYKAHSNQIHTELFGDGTGIMSSVASINGQVITLANAFDINRFGVGMTLQFCATATAGTPSNTVVVTAMNRTANQMTVSGSLTGVSPNWFVFRIGDYGLTLTGLKGWLPIVAPTSSDSFFTQNRSIDVERLAGNRLQAIGANVQEALIELCALIGIQGGNPDHIIMHPKKVAELQKALGQQVRYESVEIENGEIPISIKGFMLPHEYGEAMVIADRKCDLNLAYALQMDTWKLYSMDKIGHLVDDDGLGVLRTPNSDAIEARIRSYLQLGCKAPGYNGVAQLG